MSVEVETGVLSISVTELIMLVFPAPFYILAECMESYLLDGLLPAILIGVAKMNRLWVRFVLLCLAEAVRHLSRESTIY
jgi:hypothetical protein